MTYRDYISIEKHALTLFTSAFLSPYDELFNIKQNFKMKKYMPLNGLRWSRDSGSALCGTPPTDVLGQAGGIYIGHAYNITINQNAKIGRNCNIHKGVVIGQVNRGKRKGYPTIGDRVWIGINSAIVGKVTIGDDVLIAPNSFVNIDIPSHSVVFGNPCIIKHRDWATEGYVNNTVE